MEVLLQKRELFVVDEKVEGCIDCWESTTIFLQAKDRRMMFLAVRSLQFSFQGVLKSVETDCR